MELDGTFLPAEFCYVFNNLKNLGAPELRAGVAAMSDKQKDNTLVSLEGNHEDFVGLLNSCRNFLLQMYVYCRIAFY